MPTVIDTSTAAAATGFANQRKVARTANGNLWVAFYNGASSTTDSIETWYSTDDGQTFSVGTPFGFTGTGTSFIPNVSFFIDADDFAHAVYKDRNDGLIYYRRGTPNVGRTAWTWSTAVALTSIAGGYEFPDVVAHVEGTGWKAHVVISRSSGGSASTHYARVGISSGGTLTVDAALSTIGGGYASTRQTWPAIDLHHTGDGKTVKGGTPHLFVAWSTGVTGAGLGVRYRKATYAAGSWTWGTERELDSGRRIDSSTDNAQWLNCLFDGTTVIVGGFLRDAATSDQLMLYERDVADTTTTTHSLSTNPVRYGSMTYDADRNVYFYGSWSTTLRERVWTRATAIEGGRNITSTLARQDVWISAKRGYEDASAGSLELVYTDGAGPFSVTYEQTVDFNQAPNAPGSLSPDGSTIDRTATNRFSWSFSDPDVGDTQSDADIRYRLTSSGTWTVVLSVGGTSQFHDFAGGTFAAGDYEWQVRTYDAAGEVGPYSSSAFFTAASPPAGPSITDPIAGGTISSETYTVQWSTTSQSAYQVRTVADSAGSPDTGTVHTDTGEVTSTSARSRTVAFDTNGRDEHVQVRIKSGGLWSTWTSVNVTVSYTAPATPTSIVTAETPAGAISVAATHPAPSGSEPTVTSMDVHRRVEANGGDGIRVAAGLAPGDTYVDYAVASGVEYGYRIRAYGDNDVSSYSAWTA